MNRVVCRIAVGSRDGARSASYKLWTAKNTPDVYIATRVAPFKATLHAARPDAGLRQEGHTKVGPAKGFATLGKYGHTVVKWQGHEVAPQIWRQFLLFVPSEGLRRFPEANADEPLTWIPGPPDHHQVTIEVDIGRGDVSWGPEGGRLVAEGSLCDGRVVRVFWCVTASSPASIASLLEAVAASLPERKVAASSHRLVLFGENNGVGTFIELAADMIPARGPGGSSVRSSAQFGR